MPTLPQLEDIKPRDFIVSLGRKISLKREVNFLKIIENYHKLQ